MLNNFPPITPEDVETGKRVVEFGLWIWGLMKKKGEQSLPAPDPFLEYSPEFLLKYYKSERPIARGIPYSKIADLYGKSSSIQLHVASGEFNLQSGDAVWAAISASGFEELRRRGRISASENEPGIRLCPKKSEDSKTTFRIQKARYWDQARSNLILDWTMPDQRPPQRLRDLLYAKYGSKLPDLEDRRLANTIGVACLLFFWEKGRLIPYLVRRVEKVGVYPGGLHCTASGAANWPKLSEKSFENFFTQAMYDELREEVGLVREDIADLKPFALCREYLRGGKPQIFYAGFTRLSRTELRKKRIGAEKTIRKLNKWSEVDRKSWMESDDVILPPEKLDADIGELGVSLECKAAYYYAREYLKKDSQSLL